MSDYHVFNGDADGLCSIVPLYRCAPDDDAIIVTGRKRDIQLLSRVPAAQGDHVTVLDISMRSNRHDLRRILDAGATVFYADHHNAGDIPDHPNLDAHINTASEVCTAIIVDQHLGGTYRGWTVTGAFGDNFPKIARQLAHGHELPLAQLERLGILLNYNGYGASVDDLHFDPAALYKYMRAFDTPMAFMSERADIYNQLDQGYDDDMASAQSAKIIDDRQDGLVIELEDCAASRRVSGVYGNQLAQDHPHRAHAILTAKEGGYVVSVRAPLINRTGADALCLQFETGGGRSAAAGINHLPSGDLDTFIKAFRAAYPE